MQADTRTNDTIGLGLAILQHHNTGVLPSVSSFQGPLPALPLSDPLAATSMPEAWVRGAIVVRINSLIRGHSAVRWELLEKNGCTATREYHALRSASREYLGFGRYPSYHVIHNRDQIFLGRSYPH